MRMVCKSVVCFVLVVCGVQSQRLSNGDECTPSSGNGAGICIRIRECQAAILAIQSGQSPDTCGFEGNMPLVCCSSSASIQESVSQRKCREYATFVPEFQIFAIVGGTETQPREFPHMAALGFANGNNIMWNCGGSLISEQFVLTAAHCLYHSTFGNVTHVRLGDINLTPTTNTGSPQDFTISSRIPHPGYRSPSTYNDIALVRLSRPAQFSAFVKPACLYTSSEIPPTMELVATGWGLTDLGGNPSKTLLKVELSLYSYRECNNTYRNIAGTRRLRSGIKNDEQFCAGGRDSDKDTCQGDSGGPLQTYIQDERIYSIVGVTSFGKTCGASIPGVYSRVSHYVPWLESVVWPNN